MTAMRKKSLVIACGLLVLVLAGLLRLFDWPLGEPFDDKIFFELCAKGTSAQVEAAIKAGANVNAKNEHGWTPLMYATRRNSEPKIIITLIKNGADVNAKNKFGTPVLVFAVMNNNNPGIISALINHGANVNEEDESGQTALMEALKIRGENLGIVTTLLNHGADVNTTDASGKRAIDHASGHKALVNTDAFKKLSAISD